MTSDEFPSGPEGGQVPVLGRPSPASEEESRLGPRGSAATAPYRADGGTTGWCTLRAATVVGVRHRLAGEPSEDSFAWSTDGSKVALAVTDGLGAVAGSARAASEAAVAAVDAAVAAPITIDDSAARLSIDAANDASREGGATTIVVAVVNPERRADLARVGDSTAFVVAGDGKSWTELFAIAESDGGTLDTSTAAIPADPPEIEVAMVQLEPDDVLVLASDGIADPWRDGPATVAPAFTELVASRPSPLALARLADFSRHGCHDDRTIVLLWWES